MHSPDRIDQRRAQWAEELPRVNTVGMAILGRARLITLGARPAIDAVFAAAGMDAGEFDVIGTLLRNGPPYRLRPTELYRSLMISSGGLTDRLARLEKAGLIQRSESDGDGRSLLVELTAEGRRRAEAAFRADMKVEATLVSVLNSTEIADLERLLRKLLLSMEDESPTPVP
jgi:DNA-binding MarR family transcriptional regulator